MMTFKLIFLYLVYWICFPVVFVIEQIAKAMKKRDWYNRAWLACDLVFFTKKAVLRRAIMAGSAIETGYWSSNIYLTYNNCFGMHKTREKATWLVSGNSAQNGSLSADSGQVAKYFNVLQSFFDMWLWMNYRSKGLNDSSPSLTFMQVMEFQKDEKIFDYAMAYGACLTAFKYNSSDEYKDTLVLFFVSLKTIQQYCIIGIIAISVLLWSLLIILLIKNPKKKKNG